MQFLKSKVKGDAEKHIQHLRITSDITLYVATFPTTARYNDMKLIFSSHKHIEIITYDATTDSISYKEDS